MIALHPDEKLVLEKRRYWLPIAVEGAVSFLIAVTPFLGVIFINLLPIPAQTFIEQYNALVLLFGTGWFFLIWIVFVVAWTNYYLDVLLVTTKRVIDIEQIGLFARDLAELRMENIQDIRVEVYGFLSSLLHFGNLHIQSAGETREFVIRNIHDPHAVKELISKCHDQLMGK
jgi:hypothetical protein